MDKLEQQKILEQQKVLEQQNEITEYTKLDINAMHSDDLTKLYKISEEFAKLGIEIFMKQNGKGHVYIKPDVFTIKVKQGENTKDFLYLYTPDVYPIPLSNPIIIQALENILATCKILDILHQ